MKQRIFLILWLLAYTAMGFAQKTMYIPREWRDRTDTLIWAESDPENRYTWSLSRSIETDNAILLWEKQYGNTPPSQAPEAYRFDAEYLAQQVEEYCKLELNELGFVDPINSNMGKYKVLVLMHHTTDWCCYGGGYDLEVSALWLGPSTSRPAGHSVAHEVGHSFHYMCYAEASKQGTLPDVQTGFHSFGAIWEQTAQWQANQSYPSMMFDQSIHTFRNSHHLAFHHEWHRYQSYWLHYYLCQLYNDVTTVGQLWNYPETKACDMNQVLMDKEGLSANDLYKIYYDYASHLVTWDLDVCAPYRDPYIGDFNYRCAMTGDHEYQVALSSCPQSTGFNVIPLSVPEDGTQVTTEFTALTSGAKLAEADPGEYFNGSLLSAGQRSYYRSPAPSARGFRLGYVALINDGTRAYLHADSVYCTGTAKKSVQVSCHVPQGTQRLWFVVVPAPKRYLSHAWDDDPTNDDYWPYSVKFEGTDMDDRATVYVAPTLDDRAIGNVTFVYDLYQQPRADYTPTSVTVQSTALATLGTALQMLPTNIAGKMQTYKSAGPDEGCIMFYGAKENGTLQKKASTANGYGHWFGRTGIVTAYESGYVYSEFNPSTLTFNIGQFPGKCKVGETYTIAQALRYRRSADEEATALFIFRIHIGDTDDTPKINMVAYDEELAVGLTSIQSTEQTSPSGIFTLSGQKVAEDCAKLPRGIYVVNGKKVVVK